MSISTPQKEVKNLIQGTFLSKKTRHGCCSLDHKYLNHGIIRIRDKEFDVVPTEEPRT